MNNNLNQSREFDTVLDGEVPFNSRVVLGGIQGVKNRLNMGVFEVQFAALSDALNYGNVGLDLVIDALQDSSQKIYKIALELLQETEGKGKQALLWCEAWLFFTTLKDWTAESLNAQAGIINPVEIANISDVTIYCLCSLDLPKLECFDLWMGIRSEHSYDDTIDSLKLIIFSESFPNLRYLGLCSSDYSDAIADVIAQSSFMAESPIVATLEVLDLSMENLTDIGLNALLNHKQSLIYIHLILLTIPYRKNLFTTLNNHRLLIVC
ncbi:hypothetical protein [Nostoc sp.]|uniref:hypothetical protein n=1 Tax=Nostoc sp. TaxID=1180 RepID=UPI002FF66BB7